MLLRILIAGLLLLPLASCTTNGKSFDTSVSFAMINSYAGIKRDFEAGRIMKARSGVLELKKNHRDYAAAYKLLKQKIEPARRRIFVHYLRIAKAYEKQEVWYKAMEAYAKAKAVTIKPDLMEKKRVEMELNMRQLRLDRLLAQRRNEDAVWVQHLAAYNPPKGVDPQDEAFRRQQKSFNDFLVERADIAFDEAKRYLRNEQPEIAYIEIESHLRLQPDSENGMKLLTEIRGQLPKELEFSKLDSEKSKPRQPGIKSVSPHQPVTADQIKEAIRKNRLLEAKQMLNSYRRSGGAGANRLSGQLNKRISTRAGNLFGSGSYAFRHEQLDEAIKYWSEAVALMPGRPDYANALHRARQLKERLNLLRKQKDSDPVPEEE